ncbi:MAG: hypothetical protein L6408_07620 [Nanoarchaeota archaeon]|nr:hypothetical protein [Nanoarchaeota archaeon]
MKLGKAAKINLIATALYSAVSLASPIYAAVDKFIEKPKAELVIEEPKSEFAYGDFSKEEETQILENSLEGLNTSQLKTKYETELHSYTRDSTITSLEVEKLYMVLGKYLEVKTNKNTFMVDSGRKVEPGTLDSVIYSLENDIISHYPDLTLDNQFSTLRYDALAELEESNRLKELIEEANMLTAGIAPEFLVEKECYDIKDLILFYRLLKENNKEAKKNIIAPSEIPAEIPAARLSLTDDQFKEVRNVYESYLEGRVKEFAKASKYWSAGMEMEGTADYVGIGENFFTGQLKRDMADVLELQGYPRIELGVFYSDIGFRGKFEGKIPMPAMIIFGLCFPFLRTFLLTLYTKRKYDFGDTLGNFSNLFLGGLILDSLHPLVYPIRNFALPFVTEPIRKIFKLYEK